MPLDLKAPVSFELYHLPEAAELMADPFTAAPNARLIELQKKAYDLGLIPKDFNGRVAGAVIEKNSQSTALLTFEPARKIQLTESGYPADTSIWAPLEANEVPNMTLTNGRGETKTLRRRIREIFEPFPDREFHSGGKEQLLRRALWRRVLTDALDAPSLQLLEWFNRHPDLGRITDITEWWCGPRPSWQCRFDRTFYAPRSGVRFWFEWMLQGIPHIATQPMQSEETAPKIEVLYEDDAIVVINKPSRICSVPGVRETTSAKQILEKSRGNLFAVHRLDLDTSGILVFAKHKPAAAHLNASFSSRTTHKHYVARLEGVTQQKSGTINIPLGLNWLDRPRQCVLAAGRGGRQCQTTFEVLDVVDTVTGPKTLVKLIPQTGRTHQLRLHCAFGLGFPIDGDPFYGRLGLLGETGKTRLCLHAEALEFEHPETGKRVRFEAKADFPNF